MAASRALSRLGYFLSSATCVAAVLVVLFVTGPQIEAAVAPVITDGSLYDAAINPDGSITFRAWVTKHRACKPERLEWYRSIDGNSFESVRVQSVIDLKRVNLPVGRQPSIQFIAPTSGTYFAFVTYDCGMPWQTLATWGPFEVRP